MTENWIFLDFGSFAVYWYAVFMTLAVTAAACLFVLLRGRQGEDASQAWKTVLCVMPAALAGSRLFYVWFGIAAFTGGWRDYLDLPTGGYAFYGAVGGILAALAVVSAARGDSWVRRLDAAAVSLAAALAVGRFAGITSGEDMGFPVATQSGGRLPFLIWSETEQSWNLWVGFFEGIAAVVILAVCAMWFVLRYVRPVRGVRDGDTTLVFMMMYGLSQSAFESMRNDSLYMVTLGFVKISEILSIVMAVAAFVIVAVRVFRSGKNTAGTAAGCVCYAALLTAAVVCEFKMNAVDLLRNYAIMCVSLGLMLGLSLWLLSAGRSAAAHVSPAAVRRKARTPNTRTPNTRTPGLRSQNARTPNSRSSDSRTPGPHTQVSRMPNSRASDSRTQNSRASGSRHPAVAAGCTMRTSGQGTPPARNGRRQSAPTKTPTMPLNDSETAF